MAEQTYAQPMLNLQPREATETTWASITHGATWTRWPDSWRSSMQDYSAGWTGIINLPDRSYIHIQVILWRRVLAIKWQVDAWRMDFVREDDNGHRNVRRGTRVLLEDPTPAEALAAAAKLGLGGVS